MIKRILKAIKNLVVGPVRISPDEMQAKRREYERLADEDGKALKEEKRQPEQRG